MAQRNWLCTRNNVEEDAKDYLEKFFTKSKATYLCGLLEKGKEGTPHLQFFVNFKSKARISALTKVDSKGHYEKVTVNNGADTYCMKEDTRIEGPWEFGERPVKRNSKVDWDKIKEAAKKGNLEEVPSLIFVLNYRTLKAIKKDYMSVPRRETPRKCYWFWGNTGTGKSRTALEWFPNAYMKMNNKWWDGY